MSGPGSALHPKALRYVAAVAQLGSVQAAAREVSISASAVDRQILLLEEDLGLPLFERLPRGMRLTAAGELLLALSQRWKADLNRTLSDIKQLQGVNHGQLRLAAMDSHVNGFLPEFVVDAAREHPGIQLGGQRHMAAAAHQAFHQLQRVGHQRRARLFQQPAMAAFPR